MVPAGACRMRRAHLADPLRAHNNPGPFHSMSGVRREGFAAPTIRPRTRPNRRRQRRHGWATLPHVSFSGEELVLLDRSEEVEIETQAPEGPVHRTVIWVVVDGDDVFIRSYRGERARWYREALANPAVAVHVGRQRLSATAIDAADPDSVERVSAALTRKYSADPALRAMVAQEILSTTLRLAPA